MSQGQVATGGVAERAEAHVRWTVKALVQRLVILAGCVLAVATALLYYPFPLWALFQALTNITPPRTGLLLEGVLGLSILITAVAMLYLPASPTPTLWKIGPRKPPR